MKTIELDNTEIEKLLEYKKLTIDYLKGNSLQIYDNQITFNNNGKLYVLKSANFKFEKQESENFWVAQNLKKFVCNHLNLEQNEVIIHTHSPEETIFKVRLIPEKELVLLVCPQTKAISNANEMIEEKILKSPQIGPYRQLGNSAYYFRWIEEE